jgi:DNA polymerase-3 subunit gamma/tau
MESNNNQFVVSARKHRPATFDDVIGQEPTCRTISNSIKNKQIPSAYIFTGIRGTGKTSLARIIAKTVNCLKPNSLGSLIKPCENCINCLSVIQNNHPDIVEIDAASHTGVDDIRLIIDSAEYKPMQGLYKVFIIDEVHMLSRSAFNALLKIVEEPPQHVLFILATTEINKVPLTIISRCQKFTLKRIDTSQITQLLNKVILSENITSEEEALKIISYKADGSARDALSLLDQAISISSLTDNKNIKTDLIKEMIGIGKNEDLVNLLQAIIAKDTSNAVNIIKNTQSENLNLIIFFESFINFIGFIIKHKTIEDYKSFDFMDFTKDIELIKNQLKLPYLMVLWQIFSKGIIEIKNSHNSLLTAEIIVIKSIYASTLPSLEESIKSFKNNQSDKLEPEKKNFKILKTEENTSTLPKNIILNNLDTLLMNLYKDRKLELYYYLLNEIEAEISNNSVLKISGPKINDSFNKQIEIYIKNLFGDEYKIIKEFNSTIEPYKEKIRNNLKTSQAWKKITNNFTNASIEDILININKDK